MGITVARISAGDGYQYLVQQVAFQDERRRGMAVADYYSERGTRPGQWLGSGLAGLAGGNGLSGQVTAEQMERLVGRGVDPVTGEALGKRFTLAAAPSVRASRRVASLAREGVHLADRDVLRVGLAEGAKGDAGRQRPSVAAFDLTCEAPKSVSVLWALADDATRHQIEQAQRDAVTVVVAFLEADVVKSRVGAGGVGQVDVVGVCAAAYDHHESRMVDPHVHTHLVVSNKVQGTDGVWRSVDSQALYHAVVAASETYNSALQDALSNRLGVSWRDRVATRGKQVVREVAGVPDVLVDAFSARSRQITGRLQELTAEFATRTGRSPSRTEAEQLHARAWREGRPAKDARRASLREYFAVWAAAAEQVLDADAHRLRRTPAARDAAVLTAVAEHADAARALTQTVAVPAPPAPPTTPGPARTETDRQSAFADTQEQAGGPRVQRLLARVLGTDLERGPAPTTHATACDGGASLRAAQVDQVDQARVERLAAQVVDQVSQTRSTWTVRHLQAEAQRRTAGIRCATPVQREQLVTAVVDAATRPEAPAAPSQSGGAIVLAAPSRLAEPGLLQRADGTSVFTRHKADRYTTRAVLDAETVLLTAAAEAATRDLVVDPRVAAAVLDRVAAATGRTLGADQAEAVRLIATDGRTVTAVIGPAGTGKSTTMLAAVAVWTAGHGPGRVIAAAPSAAAAAVLTDALDSPVTADAGVVRPEARTARASRPVGSPERGPGLGLDGLDGLAGTATGTGTSLAEHPSPPGRPAASTRSSAGERPVGPVRAWTLDALLLELATPQPDLATPQPEHPTPQPERAAARPTDGPQPTHPDPRTAASTPRPRLALRPGDLVIVDEAGMAPTLLLASLTAHVDAAGAKLLLVGDDAQLGAVAAGGALRMLVAPGTGASVATLDGVRRFTHDWERAATLRLRAGDTRVVAEYAAHGRLVEGDATLMLDAAYRAWQGDEASGSVSLLVAADNDTVAALNRRARAERVAAGQVSGSGVRLPGSRAEAPLLVGVGDRVVTRKNDRSIQVLKGTAGVRNGDTWTVEATSADGSLHVRHTGHHGRAVLPAGYVQEHVQLGYASTAHRAQGATVDTAHLILTPALVRETAYVGMTRGRTSNTAYVVTGDLQNGPETHLPASAGGQEPPTGAQVWQQVLATSGAELAAHTVLAEELTASVSLATLVPRYEFAARTWRALGWPALVDEVLAAVGLSPDQFPAIAPRAAAGAAAAVAGTAGATALLAGGAAGRVGTGSSWAGSGALVPMVSTLNAAARAGLDPRHLLLRAAALGRLSAAEGVVDPVAVLQWRVQQAVDAASDGTPGQVLSPGARWLAGITLAVTVSPTSSGPVGLQAGPWTRTRFSEGSIPTSGTRPGDAADPSRGTGPSRRAAASNGTGPSGDASPLGALAGYLADLAAVIEDRATDLAATAVAEGPAWLPAMPARLVALDSAARVAEASANRSPLLQRWWDATRTVAAYRDVAGITDPRAPLGERPPPDSAVARAHARAAAAVADMDALAAAHDALELVRRPDTVVAPGPWLRPAPWPAPQTPDDPGIDRGGYEI